MLCVVLKVTSSLIQGSGGGGGDGGGSGEAQSFPIKESNLAHS